MAISVQYYHLSGTDRKYIITGTVSGVSPNFDSEFNLQYPMRPNVFRHQFWATYEAFLAIRGFITSLLFLSCKQNSGT